ncbi:MAG: hypothetical protein K2I33_02455 [Oscillospiraceae bacterium]|nr:hypothetical protein [Oscillospiraceae bacterium]
MKRMEKYIPNLLLTMILVFALIGSEGIMFAKTQLMRSEPYIEAVETNDVALKSMNAIEKYFKDSENYSGIPADVYMSAITEDDIKSMIEMKINNVVDDIDGSASGYNEMQFDFSDLEKSISDYFAEFAEENNVEIDDAYNQQLQKTIDTAESEITNFTDVYMLKMIEKTGAFSKLNKLYGFVNPLIYITVGLAVLCFIIILIMSRKNFLYWTSSAFLCSSVIAFIPCLYFKFSGYLDKLVIRNDYIYSAVTGMLNGTLNKYIALQTCIFAVGIILMVIYMIICKKTASKDKNSD